MDNGDVLVGKINDVLLDQYIFVISDDTKVLHNNHNYRLTPIGKQSDTLCHIFLVWEWEHNNDGEIYTQVGYIALSAQLFTNEDHDISMK